MASRSSRFGALAVWLPLLVLAGCAATPSPTPTPRSPADDEAGIRATLDAFPVAIAAKDAPTACGLFTTDAILVYQGEADRTRAEFCAQLRSQFANPALTIAYDPPDIQEILVSGDLASVRLIWTGTASQSLAVESIREQGLDVMRRDADGVWRIRISQAYPLPATS